MARLLVKNNRLAVRNGRLVTTAGGAPCCCGGNGPCPCDIYPSDQLQPFKLDYYTCVNNQLFVTAPIPGPFYQQWTERYIKRYYSLYEREYRVFSGPAGAFYDVRFAIETEETEDITMCYGLVRRLGSVISTVRGTRLRIQRQSGTDRESTVEELFQAYPQDELRAFFGFPGLSQTSAFVYCQYSDSVFDSFPGYSRRYEESYTTTDSGLELNGNYSYLFERITSAPFAAPDRTRDFKQATITILREGRNCDGSGGGGGSGSRPGNCAGCGNPSRLTLV
jgi:hypothetical protein